MALSGSKKAHKELKRVTGRPATNNRPEPNRYGNRAERRAWQQQYGDQEPVVLPDDE